MKVLMLAPEPFLEPRGTPISVYQRLVGLSALGHEVDLLTYHLGEDVDIKGVKVHRIPRLPFVSHVRPGPSPAKLLLDFFLFLLAVRHILTRKHDVVHSHEEAAYFGALLARLVGLTHVYDMHSSLPVQLLSYKYRRYPMLVRAFALMEKWTIQSSSIVITVGSDLEERVLEVYPKAKTIKVENLPLQLVTPSAQSPGPATNGLPAAGKIVLYTGTFQPYQGIGLLLESAMRLRAQVPDVTVIVAGGGPSQIEYWRSVAAGLGLNEHVTFLGRVPIEQTLALMEKADVLVSPRNEGTSIPMKIYTYMLSGKPLVATRIPAHTEVLTDDTAFLVSAEPAALADGLYQALTDRQEAMIRAGRARESASRRSQVDHFVSLLETAYEAATEHSGSAQPIETAP